MSPRPKPVSLARPAKPKPSGQLITAKTSQLTQGVMLISEEAGQGEYMLISAENVLPLAYALQSLAHGQGPREFEIQAGERKEL